MINWNNFSTSRIDDMLRIYPEKELQAAERQLGEAYDRHGNRISLSEVEIAQAKHLGEARAWAVHDSFFMWVGRLSNTFDELVQFVRDQSPEPSLRRIGTWEDLHAAVLRQTVYWLASKFPYGWPPIPEMLSTEADRVDWWRRVAVIHECRFQLEHVEWSRLRR